MQKYRYEFVNGDVREVEVSDEEFALLTAMDDKAISDDNYHRNNCIPLELLSENVPMPT
jgi:hypothetical protein